MKHKMIDFAAELNSARIALKIQAFVENEEEDLRSAIVTIDKAGVQIENIDGQEVKYISWEDLWGKL